MEWIKFDINDQNTWPPECVEVIAYYKNCYGHGRRIRAYFTPPFTIEASEEACYNDFCEYHEDNDQYYFPQGWYESNEHEETNWFVDEKVTHWQEFPAAPVDEI